jgi:hypothetical protein
MEPTSPASEPSVASPDAAGGAGADPMDPLGQSDGPIAGAAAGDAPGASDSGAPAADPLAQALAEADKPAAAAKPKVDLTARLASMSRKAREAAIAARDAERRAEEAQAKATDWETAIAAAKSKGPEAVRALLDKAGVPFRTVVDAYAELPDLTAEQQASKLLADTKAAVDELKAERDKDTQAAQARAIEAQRVEMLAGISQTIAKQAEKFEICARLGGEAANDVFSIVTNAWNQAGRPQLEPGEFEDAVAAAIETQELRYEERGKKLAKTAKGAAVIAAAAAPRTSKRTGLPAGLVREDSGELSDKDKAIIDGLVDKSAPAETSQRAKPRTISSSLGGSAPPRAAATGEMDPREALRSLFP